PPHKASESPSVVTVTNRNPQSSRSGESGTAAGMRLGRSLALPSRHASVHWIPENFNAIKREPTGK
ncbi:MAG: hypothetical protein ACKOEO_00140, partial [Planctomycetaceae bacterium]